MSREHVEFVQTQVLPWGTGWVLRPGIQRKLLSRDPDSGAASAVLRYPAHWKQPGGYALAATEELFVLAGELHIGELGYQPGDYACLPAGYRYGELNTGAQGAVVLTFFSAEPVSGPGWDVPSHDLVERLATRAMDWDSDVDPRVVGSGVGKKTLRLDPDTGDSTWILTIGPTDPALGGVETPLEKHPYVEEMYQLDGEISTNVGVMRRGAYFWRPPFVSHGPIASWPGFMALFRSHGGSRTTDWSEEKYPVIWDPPYRPVLPDGLAAVAFQPFDADQLF